MRAQVFVVNSLHLIIQLSFHAFTRENLSLTSFPCRSLELSFQFLNKLTEDLFTTLPRKTGQICQEICQGKLAHVQPALLQLR